MYDFLNNFLNSNYFDKLPKYISRRIFKIFKIFFVETNFKSLPDNNHPNIINEEKQNKIAKNTELFINLLTLALICLKYLQSIILLVRK